MCLCSKWMMMETYQGYTDFILFLMCMAKLTLELLAESAQSIRLKPSLLICDFS